MHPVPLRQHPVPSDEAAAAVRGVRAAGLPARALQPLLGADRAPRRHHLHPGKSGGWGAAKAGHSSLGIFPSAVGSTGYLEKVRLDGIISIRVSQDQFY